MTRTTTVPLERLRADLDQFYARHLQLLDSGRAEEWAATFTADGTFQLPGRPGPSRGRAELAEGARRAGAAQREAGETHRHWHGMLDVEARPDGSVGVRCYALVYLTPRGGDPRLHRSCVCEDVLVRVDGSWLVRSRVVTRDGH
ncbi:nuclear transport factor 2 family protein [Kitasatospora sp. NBC_00070]|uniref:nuclear transport factor 2 family protein n=1 Tax=Kitasatospora sp. NBC_00070 TaxID=2975962 RepID=UPI003251451D